MGSVEWLQNLVLSYLQLAVVEGLALVKIDEVELVPEVDRVDLLD